MAHPDWLIYHELPVVDENGIFLGMIGYRVARRIETEILQKDQPGPVADAGKALGELYWIGMSAFFRGASAIVSPDRKSS